MTTSVYLAHSHPWLSRQLLAGERPDPAMATMVDSRRDADLIIYPKADRVEDGATDRLRDWGPGELRRTCVFSQLDEPFPWAPGMYASLPAGYARGGFVGGFYVAHHHHEEDGLAADLEMARKLEPDLLWSFVGTISNHSVRRRLVGLADDRSLVRDTQAWSERIRWRWKTEHREEAKEVFADFARVLGRSSFVVCPRGRGAASIRVFEAMRVGRAPVIVSDDWLPPPFVDWSSCSVRVRECESDRLPQILREREGEARELGIRARAVWEHRFSPRRQLSTLIEGCMLAADTAPSRGGLLAKACLRRESIRRGLRRAKERSSKGPAAGGQNRI